MLMRPEPLAAAIEAAKKSLPRGRVILLTPAGQLLSQSKAEELSREEPKREKGIHPQLNVIMNKKLSPSTNSQNQKDQGPHQGSEFKK